MKREPKTGDLVRLIDGREGLILSLRWLEERGTLQYVVEFELGSGSTSTELVTMEGIEEVLF